GAGAIGDMTVGDIGRGQRLYITMSGPMGGGLYEYDGAIYARLGPSFPVTTTNSIAIHDDGAGPALYLASASISGFLTRFQNNACVPGVTGAVGFTGSSPVAMASFHDGTGPALYIAGPITGASGVGQSDGLLRWHAGTLRNVTPFVIGANPQG